MKVSSPVGDFPFEAYRLRLDDGALVVEGSMGAWPATIRITTRDIPMLLSLVPRPLLAGGSLVAALALAKRLVSRA